MVTATHQYRPDYAVPPGWVLAERLEVRGISPAEFARRCGRSPKLISEIIAGKAPIKPETALQFERVLGVDASIWLGIEDDYRLHRVREAEAQKAEESVAWSKQFPVNELVKRGTLVKSSSPTEVVSNLLSFFGVASVAAWQVKYGSANIAYRHSPSFESSETALATWLRLGEIEAEETQCADYNETAFRQALGRVRRLTSMPTRETLAEAQRLCSNAGIVLAFVKPLPKTALSGAAWWLSPRKAVIQLSARHRTDDHLWFSLFHEAAHILLHSKRSIFVDGTKGRTPAADTETDETEANAWASNFLVPARHWERFVVSSRFTDDSVRQFAADQGIAPGIVVGRLQHEGQLPWNHLNHLKMRLEWKG